MAGYSAFKQKFEKELTSLKVTGFHTVRQNNDFAKMLCSASLKELTSRSHSNAILLMSTNV